MHPGFSPVIIPLFAVKNILHQHFFMVEADAKHFSFAMGILPAKDSMESRLAFFLLLIAGLFIFFLDL